MDENKDILDFYISKTNRFLNSSISYDKAEYIFLGAPFDGTSTYRPGSKFFPSSVREASNNIEGYSFRRNFDIEDTRIHDAGDIVTPLNTLKAVDSVEKVCSQVIKDKKRAVIVGGEHTITLGASRALNEEVAVIVFDAHFDLRNEYLGEAVSHATVLRRMMEEEWAERIIHFGVRAACKEELSYAKRCKLKYYGSGVLNRNWENTAKVVRDFLSPFKGVYFSIDMDVFDPSYAPAVGNPETEGLSPTTTFDLIDNIIKIDLVGFDITEGSPLIQDSGITSILAAKTIFEIISASEDNSKKRMLLDRQ